MYDKRQQQQQHKLCSIYSIRALSTVVHIIFAKASGIWKCTLSRWGFIVWCLFTIGIQAPWHLIAKFPCYMTDYAWLFFTFIKDLASAVFTGACQAHTLQKYAGYDVILRKVNVCIPLNYKSVAMMKRFGILAKRRNHGRSESPFCRIEGICLTFIWQMWCLSCKTIKIFGLSFKLSARL